MDHHVTVERRPFFDHGAKRPRSIGQDRDIFRKGTEKKLTRRGEICYFIFRRLSGGYPKDVGSV